MLSCCTGGTFFILVLRAADRCLLALSRHKDKGHSEAGPTKRKAKEEVSSLFNKKKKNKLKNQVWKHKFICLAYPDQRRIPTTDCEKDELLEAGLGEKEIIFEDLDITADEFREIIYHHYPSLKGGGGFQFYKCTPNSRQMERLSAITLSSPSLLKGRVGNARTYILPLQKDLDLTPVVDLPDGPKEKCLKCGDYYNISKLAVHLKSCLERNEDDAIDLDVSHTPTTSDDERDLPTIDLTGNDEQSSIENEMVESAIQRSMSSAAFHEEQPAEHDEDSQREEIDLKKIIKNLKKRISICSMTLEVRRNYVVQDALREFRKRKFDPTKSIKVNFVPNEGAIDNGGPKREFFRLFALEASKIYFYGGDDQGKFMCNNISAIQTRDLYYLGVFLVLSVLHGGNGLPILALPVFNYIVLGTYSAIAVPEAEIPDPTLKFVIKKISEAEDDQDLQTAFCMDEALDLLTATGFRKPVSSFSLADRQYLTSALLDYHLMGKVKAEMDQLIDGLKTLGFLDAVRKSPEVFEPFFLHTDRDLTPDCIKTLFDVRYSVKGCLYRPAEEQTYIYFADFLDECKDEDIGCTLKEVLIFFSGSDRVPAVGFDKKPTMIFLHHKNAKLPTASTCDLELRLPAIHKTYEAFRDAMILGLQGNDGFGGV